MESQLEFKMEQIDKLDFDKQNGLLPAIIQDWNTRKVLMLGYMNREALEKTMKEKYVYFFSRSRYTLWMKGETSGNFLEVKEIKTDCDNDSLLIKAIPYGNTCHREVYSCFDEVPESLPFLKELESLIRKRKEEMPENSYTTRLFSEGVNKIAQKVGEEAVELIIEAKDNNMELFLDEAADLIYHMLVLFVEKGTNLEEVMKVLRERHSV